MESANGNASLSFKIDPQFMIELHHKLRALSNVPFPPTEPLRLGLATLGSRRK